jgi:alkanesulfonate monooxygenase SsuD/methylene tetrahydromethanopterin reductase-like flavin-dependent oxidoreductase (luciferase family)
MTERKVWFGFGAAADVRHAAEMVSLGQQADRDGLDLFSVPDHPYLGHRLDAYAAIGFILGRTRAITGLAGVTSLPGRASSRRGGLCRCCNARCTRRARAAGAAAR